MRKETWSVLIAASFAMLGLNPARADSPPPNPASSPPYQLPPECKAVSVRSVEHVAIDPGTPPRIVAKGTASSAGWKDPQLRFRSITKFRSRDASALYAFVACPPEAGAEVLTPITAETVLNLSPQLGPIHRIVIEAATNTASLDLDGRDEH
jgi:hypothetical protein